MASSRRAVLLRVATTVLVVGGGVSAVAAARAMHWQAVGSALGHASVAIFCAALGVSTIQVFLQLARFVVLVPPAQRSPRWVLLDATAIGQLLNYVAPLRSGDAYKLLRLLPDRDADKRRYAILVTALVLERLADGLSLCLMTAVAAFHDVRAWLVSRAAVGVSGPVVALSLGAGAVAVALVVAVALRTPAVRRFFDDTWRALWSGRFVFGLAVAAITWLFDAGTLWCTSRSVGFAISLRSAFECVFLLNLGIAVPITVGNLGIFEASLAFGLSRVGAPAENAIAIATLEHLAKFGGLFVCVGVLRLAKVTNRRR